MNIKRILYSTSLILFLLLDTSCSKWLDLQPIDGITKPEFWQTKEDLEAAVIGCYSSLISTPPGVGDRPIPLSIFLWGELRADMVGPTDAVATVEQRDIKDIVDLNIISTNTLVTWSAFYRTINYCNTVIEFAPEVKESDPTLSDAEYKAYVAEALAIRSLMYFYLARTFRDVPLKLKATSKDSDIEEIGKSEQAVVLQQIIADLKVAEADLPEKFGTSAQINKGRITKLAVNALLADVYLWMDNYQDCITACEKVINYASLHPGELRILPASSSWYTQVFEQGSSPETVFELSHSLNNPFGNFLFSSSRRLLASNALMSPIFEPDPADPDNNNPDIREAAFYDKENSTILKLAREPISFNNFQIYRLSDVQLMYAEALSYSGKSDKALEIVLALRSDRKAVVTTNTGPALEDALNNPEAVANFILDERAREFAFEGKRWFDLLRFAKRGDYARFDLLTEVVASTVAPAAQQSANAKLRDYDSHYLPINEADLTADTKLVQNPFYAR